MVAQLKNKQIFWRNCEKIRLEICFDINSIITVQNVMLLFSILLLNFIC